ncbi:hypothetical protein M514_11241 [Trichuris suis]|uniref:Uncharacterized protein n=1 Tax=Trichuris suis TaxID=68888 RepID=A0A085N581_9BILA|nr:hypothetical protein M514_11241 [Trichuris suis]
MSIRRGIRGGRSADGRARTDMSALTSSIEERIEAVVAPFASAVTELTQEVRKCTVSQQQRSDGSDESDDSRCEEMRA